MVLKFLFWCKRQFENLIVHKAKKEADLFSKEHNGAKYMVIWAKGKPVVRSKQELKDIIRSGRLPKFMTIQYFERKALYITS
jgi:hypothetical protein